MSLRYALATAAAYQNCSVFFVIPLLSVLEQNAKVIRDTIGQACPILEHHSNVVHEKAQTDELDEHELLTDTWNAPFVITTLVQLLNTLYAGKTSCIRRMNALRGSVLVIDEVQSVPRKMLSLFNMAINFLAYVCDVTVVLCSATQPCLEYADHPLKFEANAEIVPYRPEVWNVFRRTEMIDRRKPAGYTPEELAALLITCMEQNGNVLLICNTKGQAQSIYTAVKDDCDAFVFHLSTAMCMEHRVKTLQSIHDHLALKRPVICIATQLMEAGVDISFACVVRVLAGIDNLVQSAGRCNRSGEREGLCPVYIVNVHKENLSRLKEIRQAQLAAESVLEHYAREPEGYDNNLASEAAVSAYYRRLYTDMPGGAQDFTVAQLSTSIYTMLSDNKDFFPKCPCASAYLSAQAFKTAGQEFSVFDSNTVDILVPYGEGAEIIAELASSRAAADWQYRKELLERAKGFTISLYDYQKKILVECEGLYSLWDGAVLVLLPQYYCEETGLCVDGGGSLFMEV